MTRHNERQIIRSSIILAAIAWCSVNVPSAGAAFHLWAITEVYSNNSGTLQFIELRDTFGGQGFVNNQQVRVSNIGNTQTNTFTITTGTLPGSTLNHSLLFGTAGVQAAGGPAPDYIIPDNFLFTTGGTINFFGLNSGPYTALPIDGILSRTWTGGDAVNTPTNFPGQTGFVNGVPEPSTLLLSSCAAGLFGLYRRRSRHRPFAAVRDST